MPYDCQQWDTANQQRSIITLVWRLLCLPAVLYKALYWPKILYVGTYIHHIETGEPLHGIVSYLATRCHPTMGECTRTWYYLDLLSKMQYPQLETDGIPHSPWSYRSFMWSSYVMDSIQLFIYRLSELPCMNHNFLWFEKSSCKSNSFSSNFPQVFTLACTNISFHINLVYKQFLIPSNDNLRSWGERYTTIW